MATERSPLRRDTPIIRKQTGKSIFGRSGDPGAGGSGMNGLRVIWRNPKRTSRKRRWHELACDVGRRLYVVEELVTQGDQQRWAQSIALEMISGTKGAARSTATRAAKAGAV